MPQNPTSYSELAKLIRESLKTDPDPQLQALQSELRANPAMTDRALLDALSQVATGDPSAITKRYTKQGFGEGFKRGAKSAVSGGFWGQDDPMEYDWPTTIGEVAGNILPSAALALIPGGQPAAAANAASKLGQVLKLAAPAKKLLTGAMVLGEFPRAWNETKAMAQQQDVPGTHERIAGAGAGLGTGLAVLGKTPGQRLSGGIAQVLSGLVGAGIDSPSKAYAVATQAPGQAAAMMGGAALPLALSAKTDFSRAKHARAANQGSADSLGGRTEPAVALRPSGEVPFEAPPPAKPVVKSADPPEVRKLHAIEESMVAEKSPHALVNFLESVVTDQGAQRVDPTDAITSPTDLMLTVGGRRTPFSALRAKFPLVFKVPVPGSTEVRPIRSEPGDFLGSVASIGQLQHDGQAHRAIVATYKPHPELPDRFVSDNVVAWLTDSDGKPIPSTIKRLQGIDVTDQPTVAQMLSRKAEQGDGRDFGEVYDFKGRDDSQPYSAEATAGLAGKLKVRVQLLEARLRELGALQEETQASVQEAVQQRNEAAVVSAARQETAVAKEIQQVSQELSALGGRPDMNETWTQPYLPMPPVQHRRR